MNTRSFSTRLGVLLIVLGRSGSGAEERVYTSAELRADFEQMYSRLREAHFDLYAYTSKPELDRRYRESAAELNRPLTLREARMRFERFAAFVHMGHTRVGSPAADWQAFLQKGGRVFPLTIRIVEGRVYVAQNVSGIDALKPGDEIVALNGAPIARWLERTERDISAETPDFAHSLMEYDFAMYLWVEVGEVPAFDLDIRPRGLGARRVHLPARTQAEMETARAGQPPGLDLEHPLREARILSGNVAYLRPGPFYNSEAKTPADEWDVSGFRQFVDRAFEGFGEAHAGRIIIDLRGNPGGDNLFSDVLVSWFATRPFRFASQFKIKVSAESVAANDARIAHDAVAAGPISRQYADLYAHARVGQIVDFEIPLAQPRPAKRFVGRVFVLIDRQSYSNTVAVAALVQDYKFGVILGEATRDMATTYGAMEQFKLPNTGLMVGYPKARIVRPNGDLRAAGVTPDTPIRVPIIQGPEDEVLRLAEAIARRG